MIKKLLLASAVAVGGMFMSAGVAQAGDPDCFYPRHHYGHGHHGYYSHRPVYVAPAPLYRNPYVSPYRSGFGYGYGVPAYRSYRPGFGGPGVGIGIGGGHPFYGGNPYYGGFGGGSGFSLHIGR